ncbi:hypothetical protein KFK09_007060 [Dendrobium nobile]|uniref:Reverse transcriptase domain-containing protein n=1 Tax=Dendrobium nobile TaxID=94219 RepID=A0A8T3BTA4_DENNO|nr:hypothetical protein KFK09_007060 [Dendrobium nobile]
MVCKAVKTFDHNAYIPNAAKATAITLIPKTNHAEAISDFRPISLCNTTYKIIAKILAARMKPIMPLIISGNQSGFIHKRISTDNIILANEILFHYRNSSKFKMLCAKLDIKKAFDSVSREFLIARMIQKGFPQPFIKWINACINDVWFSVCIDGALHGFFPSSTGLRQGCPLSPYLFCIIMDAFSCLLDNDAIFEAPMVEGFRLSHLMYADDLLIFGKADIHNCENLCQLIETFSMATSLEINYGKSSLLLSKNCQNPNVISSILKIPCTSTSIAYLGIPISPNNPKLPDFSKLMETITHKLFGWKAKALSFAGRLQFLRFTIWKTIAYWIRGSIIPKTITKQIEKQCAKFLYFGDTTARKMHLISWKNTCKPKVYGGLGLPSLHSVQFSFHCSLIKRLYNYSSPLSIWVFHTYVSPWKPPPVKSTTFWKKVSTVAHVAKDKFLFIPTSMAPISLYWDH